MAHKMCHLGGRTAVRKPFRHLAEPVHAALVLLAMGIFSAVILGFSVSVSAETIAGRAVVIDGDTIIVQGQRIRLWGIDAPEHAQKCHAVAAGWLSAGGEYQCGRDASAALAGLLSGRIVSCQVRDRDRYGRALSKCSTNDGDVGGAMVEAGWAADYTRYSKGYYAIDQAVAQAAKRGIWSGRFEMPEDWRRTKASR